MAKYKIIPSSRTIVQSPISIGHKAEKGVEAIEFDVTAWVETYGSGTLTVIMRRWGDAIPYPIALEIDENNKATWTLSDTDTAKAGMAYAQLNYIVGDEVVKKSDIYTFRVMDSLTGEGEPPEAYESWLEHLTHFAAEAMAEVLDIEGIVTDKTLTVDGGIADGKATGDALALKADKSTTYTKAEVDQMIEDVEVETDTTLEIAGAPADAKKVGDALGALEDQFTEETDKLKADLSKQYLLLDEIPDTTQTYAFSSGAVSQVVHSRNNTIIRTDVFTYATNSITEVRTLNTGESLIIVTNLTTLETTVTYSANDYELLYTITGFAKCIGYVILPQNTYNSDPSDIAACVSLDSYSLQVGDKIKFEGDTNIFTFGIGTNNPDASSDGNWRIPLSTPYEYVIEASHLQDCRVVDIRKKDSSTISTSELAAINQSVKVYRRENS